MRVLQNESYFILNFFHTLHLTHQKVHMLTDIVANAESEDIGT